MVQTAAAPLIVYAFRRVRRGTFTENAKITRDARESPQRLQRSKRNLSFVTLAQPDVRDLFFVPS
jgi:hypothetical protein